MLSPDNTKSTTTIPTVLNPNIISEVLDEFVTNIAEFLKLVIMSKIATTTNYNNNSKVLMKTIYSTLTDTMVNNYWTAMNNQDTSQYIHSFEYMDGLNQPGPTMTKGVKCSYRYRIPGKDTVYTVFCVLNVTEFHLNITARMAYKEDTVSNIIKLGKISVIANPASTYDTIWESDIMGYSPKIIKPSDGDAKFDVNPYADVCTDYLWNRLLCKLYISLNITRFIITHDKIYTILFPDEVNTKTIPSFYYGMALGIQDTPWNFYKTIYGDNAY